MKTETFLQEALHVVTSINGTLEDINQSGEIPYLFLRTDGNVFEVECLSKTLFSSENDFIDDVVTCETAHCDGLSERGKKLEQFIFDRMDKLIRDLGKESAFIYSYSSNGRGL